MKLLLFMTRGMSLAAWRANGSLSRELALYEKLAGMGVDTSIISWGGKEELRIAAGYPWLRVFANTLNLPVARYEKLLPLLHAPAFLRADIIKSNQMKGADLALRCARIWSRPFIARCGYVWSLFAEKEARGESPQAVAIEAAVCSAADRVINTSPEDCAYLIKSYGLAPEKVLCIPNYVPDSFFGQGGATASGEEQPLVLCIGRLAPEKNLFALVEACAGLHVKLLLIGDGGLKQELYDRAQQCRVPLEILGPVPHAELPRHLSESTICALVSHFEGHPKALLEYMAAGCAILAADSPGIRDVVTHDHNVLVCGTDAPSIREGLQRLLRDEELRAKLGAQAREDARVYSLENIARQELAVYSGLRAPSRWKSLFLGAARIARAGARALYKKGGTAVHHFLLRSARRFIRRYEPEPAPCGLQHESLDVDSLAGRIQDHVSGMEPADALRFLFSLDARLYPLQGRLAVAYGNGLHTKHRHTRYHDFFTSKLTPGETVLDIGCGNGALSADMAASGAVVTGMDLSEENIATARERFHRPGATYICGNVLHDLPAGEYTTVVLSNVLEHLPDRANFLRRVQERIKPSRYLIRVPLFERDWRVPLKRELGVEWRLDPTHETEYTLETFLEEIQSAGLKCRSMEIRWSEIWSVLHPG